MRHLCLAAAVAGVALLALAAPASAGPVDRASARMLDRFNDVRERHGLRPLRAAPRLQRTARGFAGHLRRSGGFYHGTSYARAGFRRSGEILAMRSGRSLAARPALRQWMSSGGHRALILDPSFRWVGVAPARGAYRGSSATIWVAHFGG
ncbi:MAG: CAP domain-containing protein [Solirubrobacterales bacterium]|nr:CAP domain-containing protein [Solirubrobacterales bacterium]